MYFLFFQRTPKVPLFPMSVLTARSEEKTLVDVVLLLRHFRCRVLGSSCLAPIALKLDPPLWGF